MKEIIIKRIESICANINFKPTITNRKKLEELSEYEIITIFEMCVTKQCLNDIAKSRRSVHG